PFSGLRRSVGQARGEVAQDGQTRVGRSRRARARYGVAVDPAHGTQALAVAPTQRLHRQGQAGLRLDDAGQVELIVVVEVQVEIIGAQLPAFAFTRPGHRLGVHVRVRAPR